MAATDPGPPSPQGGQRPRITTRVLVAVVLALVVVLLASAVVGFVVLHQARLAPVPVPSVSSIA